MSLPEIEAPWYARLLYETHRRWVAFWPINAGRHTLRRLIRHAARWGFFPPCWAKLPHGWMLLDARDFVQCYILAHGEWEPETTSAIRQHLRAGDSFVDVGANVGYFTLLAASIAGPEGRVLAFEPNPAIRIVLLENIYPSGYQNIDVSPSCCADAPGQVRFFVNDASNSDASSMSSRNVGASVAVEVDAVRADSEIRRLPRWPAVVKIDAEGSESLVLRGMAETLDAKPIVILEIDERLLQGMGSSVEEVLTLLRGYECRRLGTMCVATPLRGRGVTSPSECAHVKE